MGFTSESSQILWFCTVIKLFKRAYNRFEGFLHSYICLACVRMTHLSVFSVVLNGFTVK